MTGICCSTLKPMASPVMELNRRRAQPAAARAKGIDIVEAFFGIDLGEKLAAQGRQADLIAANNVLAHVPDVNDFVGGFERLLKPEGIATFEFPHLLRLVEGKQFDTIYHEHYSYLSLTSVRSIFRANGLEVFDVDEIPTHGGSLRVFARKTSATHPILPSVKALLSREVSAGISSTNFYTRFQQDAEEIKNDLLTFLLDAAKRSVPVAAYGAAAKGNTLLNFAGVRPDLVSYVVDRNPAKAGNFMPGSRIPIVGEDRLKSEQPGFILILPWNLAAEDRKATRIYP